MRTAEQLLQKKKSKIISVSRYASIKDALRLMVKHKIGSMLVMEKGRVLGIWTERDMLSNCLERGFDIAHALIGKYMTTELYYARASDPDYLLMDKFLGLRIRHLLIQKDEKLLGMLSMGDVVKAVLQEKFRELKQENARISWDYYEEWRWKPD